MWCVLNTTQYHYLEYGGGHWRWKCRYGVCQGEPIGRECVEHPTVAGWWVLGIHKNIMAVVDEEAQEEIMFRGGGI